MRAVGPAQDANSAGFLRRDLGTATDTKDVSVVQSPSRRLWTPRPPQPRSVADALGLRSGSVVKGQAGVVLRSTAFWRCLENGGGEGRQGSQITEDTLRQKCTLTESAFYGMLNWTRTTKKMQCRVSHVDRQSRLDVGRVEPVAKHRSLRSRFLPSSGRALDHWEKYECQYAEATVLSPVLEAERTLNPGVPGQLRSGHSPRAFLTSCTGCLQHPKNWQDAVGGWSPGQSQA